MSTLLLQCVAPLQAWGTQSNFTVRDTGYEPSKSGIIGLLSAALGRERTEPMDDLAALRMGVRVDREGQVLRDYHTAGQGGQQKGFLKADGKGIAKGAKGTIVSNRYYLADAAFLVGLESDDRTLLAELHNALRHPRWLLFLGRKACPPSRPVYLPDGLKDADLQTALEAYPWLGLDHIQWKARHQENTPDWIQGQYQRLQDADPRGLRLVLEAPGDGESIRSDQPISFEKGHRRFAPRRVTTTFIPWPEFEKSEVS